MSQVTDPGPLNKYEYVSCSKVLKLDPVTDTWSSVFRWISTLYLIIYLQYIYNIYTQRAARDPAELHPVRRRALLHQPEEDQGQERSPGQLQHGRQ